ncbi:MAG: peptidase M23 [Fluviicola sp.]
MKKKNGSFWILPILIVLLAACTTTKSESMDERSKDAQNSPDDSDKANKQYAKDVTVYRLSAESGLRENNLRIAKLLDQKAELEKEVLVVRNEKIAAIRRSHDELESRMRHYRGDNRENWIAFKREFDSDMMQLAESLRDLEKEHVNYYK